MSDMVSKVNRISATEISELIDSMRHRPVATTAAQMRLAADALEITERAYQGVLSDNRDLATEIERLTKALRITELKASGTLANNLCPDHRDKQTGKPCLACEIERLRAALEHIASGDPKNVTSPIGPLHAAGIIAGWEADAKIAREALDLHPLSSSPASVGHDVKDKAPAGLNELHDVMRAAAQLSMAPAAGADDEALALRAALETLVSTIAQLRVSESAPPLWRQMQETVSPALRRAQEVLGSAPVERAQGRGSRGPQCAVDHHSPACATRRFGEAECDCGAEKEMPS